MRAGIRGGFIFGVCLGLFLAFVLGWAGEAAEMVGMHENTFIEFIIDSSFSMKDAVNKKETRMDVAKSVLTDLLTGLEDRPNLEIALRVYGKNSPSCDDTALLQGFGPVGVVRPSMLKIVKSLKPRGKTPIGLSLEEAAKDFPPIPHSRNVVVLITDGQESCGMDPGHISERLQDQGLIMKPFVVGFGLSDEDEAKVKSIGTYYKATDGESLSAALRAILAEVVAPPYLEVQAWAGSVNVTGRTKIEVYDSFGNPVRLGWRWAQETVFRTILTEGVYTIRASLAVGNTVASVDIPNITLRRGDTTTLNISFD